MQPRYNMKKALDHYAKILELRWDQNYLVADDMARLSETELTPKELYRICCKVQKAAYLSAEPFLHQERVDAVRYLLEYGIGNSYSNRFSYLPKLSREQVKDFLLSASLTDVRTLIDIVASENRELYSVERGIDILQDADGRMLVAQLTDFANGKPSLGLQVQAAEQHQEHPAPVSESGKEHTPNTQAKTVDAPAR